MPFILTFTSQNKLSFLHFVFEVPVRFFHLLPLGVFISPTNLGDVFLDLGVMVVLAVSCNKNGWWKVVWCPRYELHILDLGSPHTQDAIVVKEWRFRFWIHKPKHVSKNYSMAVMVVSWVGDKPNSYFVYLGSRKEVAILAQEFSSHLL